MRGALKPLPGVKTVFVKPGKKLVTVTYDPKKTTSAEILSALKEKGEEAEARPARAGLLPSAEPRPGDSVKAVLEAFDKFPLVALVEAPGLEQEHEWILSVLRDPSFPDKANDIVVEFGNSLYQAVLNRYLSGEEIPRSQLCQLWQDSPYSPFLSWEAPVYERFFSTVRAINQSLPASRRIRVLLTAPAVDWAKMHTKQDFEAVTKLQKPPKPVLATMVERDVLARGRKALVIGTGEHLFRRTEKNDLAEIEKLRPGSMLVVVPHLGFGGRAKELEAKLASWPRPSLAFLKGTWLGAVYEDELAFEDVADAYLYLGPADSLTVSHPSPEIYKDDIYFAELYRRLKVQGGGSAEPLESARAGFLREKPRRWVDNQ